MKLSVTSQQQEYFETHHCIEFEGILTKEELFALDENIDKTLAKRLKCPVERVWRERPEVLFQAGLHLSRDSESIAKLITSSRFSRIASQLFNQKPIRFGYDVYLTPGNADFLNPPRPFREICCIQGFLGGLLVCLEGEKAGNIMVFGPEFPLDAGLVFGGSPFFLVTYAHPTSIFLRRLDDPMCQKLGYIYGDRLTDEKNPIIYK